MRDYSSARSRRVVSSSTKKRVKKKTKKKVKKKAVVNSRFSRIWKWFLALVATLCIVAGGVYVLSLNISLLFPLKTVRTIVFLDHDMNRTDRMYLVSFIPDMEQISVHKLDESKMVNVLGGYGEYKMSAVYGLLELEKKDDQYLNSAYSLATGQLVDGVVLAKVPDISGKEDLERMLFSSLYSDISRTNESSLNLSELLEVFSYVREPSSKVDLGPSRVNPLISYVAEESDTCSVAVINATDVSGLATRVGDILTSSGLSVVRTDGDSTDKVEKSRLYMDPLMPECEVWAKYANTVLPSSMQDITFDEDKSAYFRASIVLVLGEDLE